MATDILYVEDDYVDAHYFAGTYAGAANLASNFSITTDPSRKIAAASLVASAGTLTASGIITTQVPGNAAITASASVTATGVVYLGIEGAASVSAAATLTATGTVGLGIEGSASISATASASAIPSRKITGVVDSDVIATSVTVAARRLTETALLVNTGTLSATGSALRAGSGSILVSTAEATIPSITRRGSFAIGTNGVPADIGTSYDQSGIAVPNVIFSSSSALNKLYLDDYVYTVPAESREYIIRAENREYTVKE